METITTTEITEYKPIEAVLAELSKRHRGVVFDVAQPSGMKAAKAAKADIAQYRIALEKARVKLKADVLERGRLLDGEARRISTQLAALEDPIDDQIKAEERREEAARQAAILAEQQRLEAEARAKKEAEERALAEARAKLDAERAAFEQQQAAARAKEEEARKVRQAEEDRLRAEQRRLDEERRKVEQAAEDKARAERQAAEEAERKVREAREATAREERRKINELLDAEEMAQSFVARFGHLKRFAPIVRAIKALPPAKQQRRAA